MSNTITGLEGMMSPMEWRPKPPDREKIYEKADANGDGTLDKAEFTSFLDEMSQNTGMTVDTEEAFTLADSNEDGTIDQEEFFAAGEKFHQQMGPGNPPPPMMGMKPQSSQSLLDMLNSLESSEDNSNDSSTDDSTGSNWNLNTLTRFLLESYTANQGILSGGAYNVLA